MDIDSTSATAPETPDEDSHPDGHSDGLRRVMAAVALLWGGVYLVWRLGWTWSGTEPVLYVVLVTAEIVGWVSLAFYAFLTWRPSPCPRVPVTTVRTVDVLVPTYDEPVEVLRATLLGCNAVTHPHTTWLLDDGRRPEMEQLAESMGCRYLTRADNEHAKAGNINAALPHLHGELMAVLDADHVPLPDFLDALVGHFDDPEVVLVQAPHEFSNLDSVQHMDGQVHEQSLFFRVICPGKERDDSVFWCGSGTVLRRRALVEIGGVQTTTIAEDFHTSIVLHQRGGATRYVEETVLLGLAPHDLDSFLLQRSRWARGNLRVLRTAQSPIWARKLSMRQRLSYLGSLSHYFSGPQRLALLVVLCATLLSGSLPIHGEPIMFAILWAPWVLLSLWSTKLLGRGYVGPITATQFGWTTMGIYTGAAVGLVFPAIGGFKVTPKGGVDPGGISVLRRLPMLSVAVAALFACFVSRALAALGWVVLPAMPTFALYATLLIGAFELTVILAVLRSLAGHRQQRSNYRVGVDLSARAGDHVVRVSDLTVSGAGLIMDSPRPVGSIFALELRLPGLDGDRHDLQLRVRVRSVQRLKGDGVRLGVEFVRPDEQTIGRIIEYSQILLPARNRVGDRVPAGTSTGPTGALAGYVVDPDPVAVGEREAV